LQRTVLVALVALAAAAMAATVAPAASTGAIDLRIAYRATPTAGPKVFTLSCNPARGTVPNPGTACRKLQGLGRAGVAPTPHDRVCTQIAGPPGTAVVTGIFQGRRIWARLTQHDGCQIARWNLVSFLLPRWKSGRPISS
jgi:hypothetical protein